MAGQRRDTAQRRKRTSDGRFAPEPATRPVDVDVHAASAAASAAIAQPISRLPSELFDCDDPVAFAESRLGSVEGVTEARSDLLSHACVGPEQTASARRLAKLGHDPRACVLAAVLGPLPEPA